MALTVHSAEQCFALLCLYISVFAILARKSMSNVYIIAYWMCIKWSWMSSIFFSFFLCFIHSTISNRYFYIKKKKCHEKQSSVWKCPHTNQFSFLPVCAFISFFVAFIFSLHFSLLSRKQDFLCILRHARKHTYTHTFKRHRSIGYKSVKNTDLKPNAEIKKKRKPTILPFFFSS